MDEVSRRLAIQEENRQQKLAWLLYHRQQSLVDGYAERFEQAVLKLFDFVGNSSKQLDLSRLSEPDRKKIEDKAAELSASGPVKLRCTVDISGPDPVLRIRKKVHAGFVPPPTPPPPPAALPTEEEPVQHLPYNDHAVNMQIVRPSSPTPAADPTPSVPQPPRAPLADPQPPAESSRPNHSASRPPVLPPPRPYDDVPEGVRRVMRALPFRVKYEVEVLIGLKKLPRWPLLEVVAWPELLAIMARVGAVPPVPVRVIPEGVAMVVS